MVRDTRGQLIDQVERNENLTGTSVKISPSHNNRDHVGLKNHELNSLNVSQSFDRLQNSPRIFVRIRRKAANAKRPKRFGTSIVY